MNSNEYNGGEEGIGVGNQDVGRLSDPLRGQITEILEINESGEKLMIDFQNKLQECYTCIKLLLTKSEAINQKIEIGEDILVGILRRPERYPELFFEPKSGNTLNRESEEYGNLIENLKSIFQELENILQKLQESSPHFSRISNFVEILEKIKEKFSGFLKD